MSDAIAGKPSNAKAFSGFFWMMTLGIIARVAGFLTQMILSRILSQNDFGEIGLAYTVITVATMASNFGVDDVLVQRGKQLGLWASTGLVISFVLGLIGAVAIIVAAPIAATYYHIPRISDILLIASVTLPITALATPALAKLRQDLRFRSVSAITGVEILVTSCATILLAKLGFGALSFVLPVPFTIAGRVIAYWVLAPVPLTRFRFRLVPRIFGRSLAVWAHRVVVTLISQADYVLLGLMTTTEKVGYYYFAFRLANQPLMIMANSLQSILFPLLTQHQRDEKRQLRILLRVLSAVNFVVMPVCFLQATAAPWLVPLFFGDKWAPAVILVEILTLGLCVEAAAWQAGALLSARGNFVATFKYTFLLSLMFVPFIVLGYHLAGVTGVAYGVAAYYLISSAAFTYLALRKDSVTLKSVAYLYGIPASISFVTAAVGRVVGNYVVDQAGYFAAIAAAGLVGLPVYLLLWRSFGRDSFDMIFEKLTGRLGKFFRK